MEKRTRIGGVVKDQKTLKEEIGVSHFRLMDFPTAVLDEILFRLPINSIIKVKFVCRVFYKLSSDPNFAVNYTKISPFVTFLIPTHLYGANLRCQHFDLLEASDDYECIRTTFKPKIPGWSKRISGISVRDTSNGLVCLSMRKWRQWRTDFIYICNPITGECIALPKCKIKRWQVNAKYGFGFCRSTNNYKVLRIVCNPVAERAKGESEIFTVGIDNTWRGLANPAISFYWIFGYFIALNGALILAKKK